MKTFMTIHAVARNSEGKYLILQRAEHRTNPGKWNFVTGHVQERESAEAAALRELKEETNLEGKILKTTLPWWREREDIRFIIVSSLIEVTNESELLIDPGESQSHRWVSPDEEIVASSEVMSEDLRLLA